MANLLYICLRKGLPSEAEQRSAMAAAGATEEELADPWRDDCRKRVRSGLPAQPARDYIPGAARKGDVVMVARLGVLATTHEDALRFVSAIAEHGAVLHDASSGRRYSVRPEAAQDVADALALAADIAADERRASLAKARSHITQRASSKTELSPDRDAAARAVWFNHTLSGLEAAAQIGLPLKTCYNLFGKRGSPAFGAALNKRRGK